MPLPSLTVHKDGSYFRIFVPARYSSTGKRMTLRFESKKKASEWRKDFLNKISKEGESSQSLNAAQIQDAMAAMSLLAPYGTSLSDAARAWIRTNAVYKTETPLEDVWTLFVDSKAGLSRYVFEKINRLEKILAKVMKRQIGSISSVELSDIITKGTRTDSMFNEALGVASGFFAYAARMMFIERNPAEALSKKKTVSRDICVVTPEQAERMMSYKKTQLPVALLLFSGIRVSELRRLRWDDVDLDEHRVIRINGKTSKTGSFRLVEVNDTLKAWMEKVPPSKRTGGFLPVNWENDWKKCRKQAGIEGKGLENICRHSYASYLLAVTNDINHLRTQLGHDTDDVTLRHYRARVYREAAERYWRIMP